MNSTTGSLSREFVSIAIARQGNLLRAGFSLMLLPDFFRNIFAELRLQYVVTHVRFSYQITNLIRATDASHRV
jgi:hypothetical protein